MIREFHHISLRDRNSFGVEQQAARLAEFETADDLRAIFAGGAPAEWCVLSGGNNILFTRDYDGLLLTPAARGIARDEGRGRQGVRPGRGGRRMGRPGGVDR